MDFESRAERLAFDIIDQDLEDCSGLECQGMKVMTIQLVRRLTAFAREAYDAGRATEAAMWEKQRLIRRWGWNEQTKDVA